MLSGITNMMLCTEFRQSMKAARSAATDIRTYRHTVSDEMRWSRSILAPWGKVFSQGFYFYVYIKSPNPIRTQKTSNHRPQTSSVQNPTQNCNLQTTIHEKKNVENNREKKMLLLWFVVNWDECSQHLTLKQGVGSNCVEVTFTILYRLIKCDIFIMHFWKIRWLKR